MKQFEMFFNGQKLKFSIYSSGNGEKGEYHYLTCEKAECNGFFFQKYIDDHIVK